MTDFHASRVPPVRPEPDHEKLAGLLASPAGFAVAVDRHFVVPPHLRYLNEKLVALATGRIKRLIVQMPPRHGKSELCSKFTPAWYVSMWPDKRIILASYESRFAASWGRKARDLINEYSKDLYGIELRKDTRAADEWYVNGHRGGMATAGVGGPITGKGGDLVIIDDPVKNDKEALSRLYRDKAWDWYRSTLRTRIEPGGSCMLIMTRWHEDDLAGRLINREGNPDYNTEEEWEVVDFPAVALESDCLGRIKGDPLWPQRYDNEDLRIIRASVGPYWWSSLYQQKPSPEEGAVLRREWFNYYKRNPSNPNELTLLLHPNRKVNVTNMVRKTVIDLAITTTDRSDYTVISTWAYGQDGRIYLLDLERERMESPDIMKRIVEHHKRNNSHTINIESNGYGLSFVQLLKTQGLPIRELKADRDKQARLYAAVPAFEQGHVFFPQDAHWLSTYETEILQAPNSQHDDQADVTAYAVGYLGKKGHMLSVPNIQGRLRRFPKGWQVNQPTGTL